MVAAGFVGSISAATVRRILKRQPLKPWRHHLWLSPKVPRDKAFVKSIRAISRLYTRKLKRHERVVCLDEKTSLQPRPRKAPTLPAKPHGVMKVEQEYERKGALIDLLPLKLAPLRCGGNRMNASVKMNSSAALLNISTKRFLHRSRRFMWCWTR